MEKGKNTKKIQTPGGTLATESGQLKSDEVKDGEDKTSSSSTAGSLLAQALQSARNKASQEASVRTPPVLPTVSVQPVAFNIGDARDNGASADDFEADMFLQSSGPNGRKPIGAIRLVSDPDSDDTIVVADQFAVESEMQGVTAMQFSGSASQPAEPHSKAGGIREPIFVAADHHHHFATHISI